MATITYGQAVALEMLDIALGQLRQDIPDDDVSLEALDNTYQIAESVRDLVEEMLPEDEVVTFVRESWRGAR